MKVVRVEELLEALGESCSLKLAAGEAGLKRPIGSMKMQRAGLTLAGYDQSFHADQVQVFGRAEIGFTDRAAPEELTERFRRLCRAGAPVLVVCNGNSLPRTVLDICDEHGVAVLDTPLPPEEIFNSFYHFLKDRLTERTTTHGVLVDVLGVGILLLGKSGIGKSECAIELVMRGHRLVSDDVVEISKEQNAIYGSCPELIRHHMEIKGLGIINVRDLFGIAATRDKKKIELVVQLVEWGPKEDFDRLGLDEEIYTILDIGLPYMVFPVAPGRNISVMVEIAARNQLLKLAGHHSAREFERRFMQELSAKSGSRDEEGGE